MKSKEEIEQLAEKAYPIKKDLYRDLWNENNAYVKGYTQCQEDMTKEMEYLLFWYMDIKGVGYRNETLFKDVVKEYINSLKKQD
jgi:hypothetical protein